MTLNVEKECMIFGKDNYLSMNQIKTHLNCNSMVIGASGAGKTRSFLYPNLMQMNGSYIIVDTKGQAFRNFAQMFENNGYAVKLINLVDPTKGLHYNPFHYFKDQKDLESFVKSLVYAKNEEDPEVRSRDPFWERAAEILLGAICGYLWKECLPEEQNIGSVLKLLSLNEVKYEDNDFKSVIDHLFDDVQKKYEKLRISPNIPDPFYLRKYKQYKLATDKTAMSINITAAAALGRYDNDDIRQMMSDDEIEIDMIGDRKTAIFVIVSDTDSLFHPIAGLFIDQCLKSLIRKADERDDGKLPVHVSMFIDDAASIPIYGMDKYMAEVRSREISINLIFQNENQLTTCYGSAGADIRENCNTYLFLGGNSVYTEEIIGKWFDMDPKDVHKLPHDKALIMQKSNDGKLITKFYPEDHPCYSQSGLHDSKKQLSPDVFTEKYIKKMKKEGKRLGEERENRMFPIKHQQKQKKQKNRAKKVL